MTLQPFRLPCFCMVVLDFDCGERRVVCEGDDPERADRRCPGGRGYVIKAERVETVLFTARALPMPKPKVA